MHGGAADVCGGGPRPIPNPGGGCSANGHQAPGHTADDVATYVTAHEGAHEGSDATFGLHTGRAERPGGDEHSRVQGGER